MHRFDVHLVLFMALLILVLLPLAVFRALAQVPCTVWIFCVLWHHPCGLVLCFCCAVRKLRLLLHWQPWPDVRGLKAVYKSDVMSDKG